MSMPARQLVWQVRQVRIPALRVSPASESTPLSMSMDVIHRLLDGRGGTGERFPPWPNSVVLASRETTFSFIDIFSMGELIHRLSQFLKLFQGRGGTVPPFPP